MFQASQGQLMPSLETGLSDVRLRSNPDYELILFDRLAREQQDALRDLQDDPDFYGILRPRAGTSLGIKSVDQQTALLYLTMQQAGLLPQYVQRMLGQSGANAVIALVLDGILEIEHGASFVSGAAAAPLLTDHRSSDGATNRNAALSIEALKYGQALKLDDVRQLSYRLYSYNREPLSPAWHRRLPTGEVVTAYLGLDHDGTIARHLSEQWLALPDGPAQTGWRSWRSRRHRRTDHQKVATYKLYISPRGEYITEAFAALVAVTHEMKAFAFKIGRDVYGLLRPDKLVAYFTDFDDLAQTAEALRSRLNGLPAQGVPFTAGVTSDGLLSWGMDPPKSAQTPLLKQGESWRLWLTNRLARALVDAQASPIEQMEPWEYALRRLALDGVDTATWAPAGHIWRDKMAAEA